MSNDLPRYVTHGGALSFPAPIVIENGLLTGFFIKADPQKLSNLLARVFHEPSQGKVKYVPIFTHVYMTLGYMPKIYSSKINVGWATERELTVWIPAAAVHIKNGREYIDRLVVFPSCVIVDDPYSLVSGREALGFFKSWGTITGVEDNSNSPQSFEVQTFGHKIIGDKADYHQLLTFEKMSEPGDDHPTLSTLREVIEYLIEFLKKRDDIFHPDFKWDLRLFYNLFKDMWEKEFPIALLKQLRDSTSTRAVYQAILESMTKINKFQSFHFLDFYKFSLNHVASLPLGDELGIEPNSSFLLGTRISLDFEIDGGKEIWKA
jgi:hypothetical protein